MTNVFDLKGVEQRNAMEPDELLEEAKDQLVDGMVLGWDKEGVLYYRSTLPAGPENLWLLQCASYALLHIPKDEETP